MAEVCVTAFQETAALGPVEVAPGGEGASGEVAISTPVCAVVVITPSAQSQTWTELIHDAARSTGMRVADLRDSDHWLIGPDTVVIAGDIIHVRQYVASFKTFIMTGIASTMAFAPRTAAAGPFATASLALAGSASAERDWRMVTDESAAARGSFELWPGAVVKAPKGEGVAVSPEGRALSHYSSGVPPVGARAHWPASLFTFDSRSPDRSRPEIVELTGPARALVFGPYAWLTPGVWRATARFSVDDEAMNHELRFEWGTTTTYVHSAATPRLSGRYQIALEYVWPEPLEAEFRVILTQGSLGGAFEFVGLDIHRIA